MKHNYVISLGIPLCLVCLSQISYAQPYPSFQEFLNGNSPLVGKYKHPYRIWETEDVRANDRFSRRMGPDGRLRMSRPSLRYHFANLDYFYNVPNPNTFDYEKRQLNVPKGTAPQSTHLAAPSQIRRKQDFLNSLLTPPLNVHLGQKPKKEEANEPVELPSTVELDTGNEEKITRSRSPYELLLVEAQNRINKRQYKSAAKQLKSLNRLQNDNLELQRDYGLSLFLSGEYEKAAKPLRTYLQQRNVTGDSTQFDVSTRVAQDFSFISNALNRL